MKKECKRDWYERDWNERDWNEREREDVTGTETRQLNAKIKREN
jgi:hypothetical protein